MAVTVAATLAVVEVPEVFSCSNTCDKNKYR